ncbi:MAG: SNF2-related protein [Candidatus Thorarchaeota archaeon]
MRREIRELQHSIVRLDDDPDQEYFVLSVPRPNLGQAPRCKLLPLGGTDVMDVDLARITPVLLKDCLDLDEAFSLAVSSILHRPPSMIGLSALSGRTKLKHYQLRPLLKYFQNPSRRLLIADEAGLGKTIEALYIMVEEMNRRPLDRVVVLCPSHLKGKWWWEILSRFGIGFSRGNFHDLIQLI